LPAPAFVQFLFGFRPNGDPNNIDANSVTSRAIATEMFTSLGIAGPPRVADPGSALELAVRDYLRDELPLLDPNRPWLVGHHDPVTRFAQYEHLLQIQALAATSPTLRVELPQEYVIAPDVTVGLAGAIGTSPALHASVSCKWTLRSDRAQNVRHEATILMRTRRDRLPHIVAVTAEPMPTRLASLARGTGEVDAVYHVALDELLAATHSVGTLAQRGALDEMVGQNRLRDFSLLAQHLAAV
jgi:hypothetical protein